MADALAGERETGSSIAPMILQYIAFEQSLLQTATQLADSKSAFVLAISSAIVGYLLNFLYSVESAATPGRARGVLWGAVWLAGLAALSALLTIFPRLWNTETLNLTYWGSPPFKGSLSAYKEQVLSAALSPADLVDQEINHLHRIAGVLRKKYLFLKAAILLLSAALFCFVIGQGLR